MYLFGKNGKKNGVSRIFLACWMVLVASGTFQQPTNQPMSQDLPCKSSKCVSICGTVEQAMCQRMNRFSNKHTICAYCFSFISFEWLYKGQTVDDVQPHGYFLLQNSNEIRNTKLYTKYGQLSLSTEMVAIIENLLQLGKIWWSFVVSKSN